jgi:DNTTIP1 dimerisation domain
LQEYFHPAVENIRLNNGDNSVSEEHMQTVCRQILEEVFIACWWLADVI